MTCARIASCLIPMVASVACSALNYAPPPDESAAARAASTEAPSAPVLLGVGFGVPEDDIIDASEETAQEWSELTRKARLDRQMGRFEEAREALEQASLQLAGRPATNAQRRAVCGLRARLAKDFVALERDEEANALADELFDEVEQEPELGGAAISELAYLFATLRTADAEEAGEPDSQLRLMRIALDSAEAEAPSQTRLNLAYEVSGIATREEDHDLARRAIDRAVLDAQILAPADKDQMASLKIYKARIALAQGDLLTAEASAISANRIFEEIEAPSANRGVAEATLARALAERGDLERARAIETGTRLRLEGEAGVTGHAARLIRAELARMERAAGDTEAARAEFEAALAIPEVDFAADRELVATLEAELAALENPEPASPEAAAPLTTSP